MIFGIGIDIIETVRIEKACNKWGGRFIYRIFTQKEIDYCNSKKTHRYQSLASRFAAKEAMFKALGTGWNFGMRWKEIEVVNDHLGKPDIVLSGEVSRFAEKLGIQQILVSLSHTKQFVVAQVVLTSRLGKRVIR